MGEIELSVLNSSDGACRGISPLGRMWLGLDPLLMATNWSPIAVSDAIWAVESAVMFDRRSRSTVIVTLTMRAGLVEPESATDCTLPTPMPLTRTGDPDPSPEASERKR